MLKKFLYITLILFTLPSKAQTVELGKIVLNPYVETSSDPNANRANKILLNKLNQIITKSGMAGSGLDDRFIITANTTELETTITATAPAKYVSTLMVTVYLGDAIDGALFAQWSEEIHAVGDSKYDCYANAYRKINANESGLINMVEEGKRKIILYYNDYGPQLIARAQAEAKAGNYDRAISRLLSIPTVCNSYSTAMKLAGQLGVESIEKSNLKLIETARAQWAANPNEEGANEAMATLSNIEAPSANVLNQTKQLSSSIAKRLKAVDDRQFALEKEQAQHEMAMEKNRVANQHRERMSAIRSAENIAIAYYRSKPKRIYKINHYHWW